MANSSISSMRLIYGIVHLLIYILSSIQFGHFRMANGFEVPSRYNSPKRIHESASNTEVKYPKSLPSQCKYDLGLGKNHPIKTNSETCPIDRQITKVRERSEAKIPGTETFDERDGTGTATYEACRFLVEHEATRMYPAPNDRKATGFVTNNPEDVNSINVLHPTTNTETNSTSAGAFLPKQITKEYKHEYMEKKATAKIAIHKAVPAVSGKPHKSQHPVNVEPKRFLEDCLIILDHDQLPESSSTGAAATVVSMNSTIWSGPDTPKLDMNSIWVEMLLHNQMAHSRTQG